MNRRQFTACALGWLTAPAQEAPPVFRIATTLVEVPVIVTDRSGRYVPGLEREQFRVLEDEVAVDVAAFESAAAQLTCAILMDVTGSMQNELPALKNAVNSLISGLRSGDLAGVFSFNTSLQTLHEFSGDRKAAMTAVLRTRAQGATALFDAIAQTARILDERRGKKALVVFTDGADNSSMLNLESALARLKRASTPVYVVAQGEALRQKPLMETLKDLGRSSGGASFEVKSRKHYEEVFAAISRDLQHSYMLSYRAPQKAARKWRTIQVTLNGGLKYKLRAKEGYFPE